MTSRSDKLVYEIRNGLTEGNPSEWGKEGFWRGSEFLGGAGGGWDSNYEPLSKELQKEITESVNALAGRDPNRLGELEKRVAQAVKFLKTLPADCLGIDPQDGYPYRDEMVASLASALAAFRKEIT